jgi:glycine hydroxymethyltransferase
MPVWYTSALEEHRAIRDAAGLFDLGHMGVFQVSGEYATEFLNNVTANYAAWLEDGESQYAHLFDPEGNVIDDIFVYRRAADRYLVVVNASNEDKDWEWLTGVNEGRYLIDSAMPSREIGPRVALRDLKRERGVMDIALQGPKSEEIMMKILDGPEQRSVAALKRTEFCEIIVEDRQMIVARTGYTGEEVGYEIYLAAPDAQWLWEKLLEVGSPLGLIPCGLASRDSTRTEAGFPLYGHELAGEFDISPAEAGFPGYVKYHKPFFVGRDVLLKRDLKRKRELIRWRMNHKGVRRPNTGDPVVNKRGQVIGHVTSCSIDAEGYLLGLAIVNLRYTAAGTPIEIFVLPPRPRPEKQKRELEPGDKVLLAVSATVLTRFPEKETKIPLPEGD